MNASPEKINQEGPDSIKFVRSGDSRQIFYRGKELIVAEGQKLINHSPDGFEWGYGGSGPSQSAWSICLAILKMDGKKAIKVYQDIKWKFISRIPQQGGEILASEVEAEIDRLLEK